MRGMSKGLVTQMFTDCGPTNHGLLTFLAHRRMEMEARRKLEEEEQLKREEEERKRREKEEADRQLQVGRQIDSHQWEDRQTVKHTDRQTCLRAGSHKNSESVKHLVNY